MGKHDSSRTRVAPVFDRLRAIDPTGRTWLPKLLALPTLDGRERPAVPASVTPLVEACWWPRERKLPAPVSLLEHLIREAPRFAASSGSAPRGQPPKRAALFGGDAAARAEAIDLIAKGRRIRGWHVLEGPSQPDVFLATDEIVVVIEGKRTEAERTKNTEWMPVRDQMLRHLDAAWEVRNGRQLFGFMIVEGGGEEADAKWQAQALEIIPPEVLAGSLPHRSDEERQQIARAFLGITTWQKVCAALEVSWTVAIPEVVATAR